MNGKVLAGLMVLAAGGVTLGLLGGDGKGGDVGPVEPVKVEELRPVVLPGECVPPPGDEPLDQCAVWTCHDKEGKPTCAAYRDRRPAGCVSQANSYEVEGKTLPGCLPEAAPGSSACDFPAETWLTWKAASDAHKDRLGVCREQVELGNGSCLCKSHKGAGDVPGELADASALPAGKRTRLVSCPPKDGKGPAKVMWEADVGEPRPGCVVAARPMVTVTAGEMPTDLVVQLQQNCGGWVTGTGWICCPYCLAWVDGCPPSPELCSLGDGWKAHVAP